MEKLQSASRLEKVKNGFNKVTGLAALTSALVLNSCKTEPEVQCECMYRIDTGITDIFVRVKTNKDAGCNENELNDKIVDWYDNSEETEWLELSDDVNITMKNMKLKPRVSSEDYKYLKQ